jgi:rRNA maturation endonuclease Nob1
LAKKGLSVWISSSLTFIALAHLVDAVSALVFNNEIKLLQLYPIINQRLQTITPALYFWVSAVSVLILWGITCAVAFDNPVETFLNKVFSDAKDQSQAEAQVLEGKSEVLDAIYETVETGQGLLGEVKDLMCNVRADVREIRPVKESIEKMKAEMVSLRREVKKVQEKAQFPDRCQTCGKPLLPEFKLCPYCGANIKLLPPEIIAMTECR